jgi:hypothetical protein
LRITNENDVVLSWLHSQVGVPYQVSQIISKGFGLGNLIAPAAAIAATASTGNAQGALIQGMGEIGNAVSHKIPSATTIGSNGSIDSLLGTPALQCEFKDIVSEDLTRKGRPLCQVKTINTLSGYIKTLNAFIAIAATQVEKSGIINYMEGGFFYE